MEISNESDLGNMGKNPNLKEISPEEIEVVSVDDVWDGPLSGNGNWNGNSYYFHYFSQLEDAGEEDRWPRKYLLIKLNPEQESHQARLNTLFQRLKEGAFDKDEYARLLEDSTAVTISSDQIMGWFDSGNLNKEAPSRFMKSYLALERK